MFGTIRSEAVLNLVTPGGDPLVMVTATGGAKRVDLSEAARGRVTKQIIKLKPGDRVVAAFCAPQDAEMVLVSAQGRALRAPVASVPVQGRGAAGVAGMKLRNGDRIIAAGGASANEAIITVSTGGSVSITPVTDIPATARGGLGTPLSGDDPPAMAVVAPPADLLAEVGENGKPAKAPVPLPRAGQDVDDVDDVAVLSVGIPRW